MSARPPGIDDAPDVSDAALQALVPGALYCNVAGDERLQRGVRDVGRVVDARRRGAHAVAIPRSARPAEWLSLIHI